MLLRLRRALLKRDARPLRLSRPAPQQAEDSTRGAPKAPFKGAGWRAERGPACVVPAAKRFERGIQLEVTERFDQNLRSDEFGFELEVGRGRAQPVQSLQRAGPKQ